MWLSRELRKSDYLSFAFSGNRAYLVASYHRLLERSDNCPDATSSRYSEHTNSYTSLNAGQRVRFHAAMTAVWYLNEVR
ncbi:hypothetical protein BDV96DRAFT_565168 [Lophiotrema nucula]|uniref:Uncharacterized protein n=1 Tax=Lophiotrema nucula TaxID=690887 RepID=A0A6A5ZLU4_9PLEO|nr:hypothetical protein BDV96DRAFT_565168 [Lophiotrema nucula]